MGRDAARDLSAQVPPGVAKVALTVDMDDAALDALVASVPLDMIQLHGRETPERARAIRARHGLPVMKAVGVRDAADMAGLSAWRGAVDQLLLDAKPPEGATLPGGNGAAFDWSLLEGLTLDSPWMLAGGLTPQNVAEAIAATGARQVDVSSGVESAPGVKDAALIAEFVRAAHTGA